MSVKTKAGYFCDRCQRPVPGQKTTHRTRGAVGILAAPLTAGLSLVASAPDGYHCPNCGGPVHRATRRDTRPARPVNSRQPVQILAPAMTTCRECGDTTPVARRCRHCGADL